MANKFTGNAYIQEVQKIMDSKVGRGMVSMQKIVGNKINYTFKGSVHKNLAYDKVANEQPEQTADYIMSILRINGAI